MKKIVSALLSLIIIISSLSCTIFAADDIKLTINGEEKVYVIAPQLVNGEIFVPVMDLFRDLSCEALHVKEMNTVTVSRNNITVKVTRDSTTAYINGVEHTLTTAPKGMSQKFMVPAEFILNAIGDTGYYDESTNTYKIESEYLKTVAYQDGLAPLYSNVHRDIPTDFESGNSYDDIKYYTQEEIWGDVTVPDGEDILTTSDLVSNLKPAGNTANNSTMESVMTTYGTGIRFNVTTVPETETDCIYNMNTYLSGFDEGDTLVISFMMRTTSGGDGNGNGRIIIQNQEKTSGEYNKNLYENIYAGSDWKKIQIPFEAKADYKWFSIRVGYFVQKIEIADFKIENIGTALSVSEVPSTSVFQADSEKDAAWRKTALDTIDQIRKGDFSVVVKDKYGRVVPNAHVKFDMFESEYKFGTAITAKVINNQTYRNNLGKYFNSIVIEHAMKWGPYEENPADARNQINSAVLAGIKHVRGHSVAWEQKLASDGITYLVPEYCFNADGTVVDEETYKGYMEAHMKRLLFDYAGEVFEWDVINELADNREFIDVYGDSIIDFYVETARKYAPHQRFFYNEKNPGSGSSGEDFAEYNRLIEYISDNGIDVDAIGFQSHRESGIFTIVQVNEMFDKATDLGFDIGVTEYSYSVPNEYQQANYTRDYFINAFAHPNNNEFLMWGFWDGNLYADYGPMFDENWNLKPSGEQLVDLMYNKFWTRGELATTHADGMATINGFYGDYDVTVSVDGYEEVKSCAFHKGYGNVMEFVLTDYAMENSENDLFSFVYSGKIQVGGKLTSDYTDLNEDFIFNQVTLLMMSKDGEIAHIAQTPIKSDKTYEFEFKKDGLIYKNGVVEDYYVILNVNGVPVTETVTTSMLIPECVTFDFDITQSEGKISVATTLNNLIKRKSLDYTVYISFYDEKNSLLGMKKAEYSTT